MNVSRRSLITGLSCIIAAPAIVRASSLMAIKPLSDWVMVKAVVLDLSRHQFAFSVPGTPSCMSGTTWGAKRYREIADNYRSIHPDMVLDKLVIDNPHRSIR